MIQLVCVWGIKDLIYTQLGVIENLNENQKSIYCFENETKRKQKELNEKTFNNKVFIDLIDKLSNAQELLSNDNCNLLLIGRYMYAYKNEHQQKTEAISIHLLCGVSTNNIARLKKLAIPLWNATFQ